jgi:hypothetical protein
MPYDKKVKSCAHCGGKCCVSRVYQTDNEWVAFCKSCGVMLRKESRSAVVKAWNQRASAEVSKPSDNSNMVPCPKFMRNRNCDLWDLAWVCGNRPCYLSQHQ